MFITSLFQLLQYVLSVWCSLNDIIITHLGVVHGETVMVLAGDRDIFHTSIFSNIYPLISIKLCWIEKSGQHFVRFDGYFLLLHDPFGDTHITATCHLTIHSPMDKESEFGISKSFPGFNILFSS